MLNNINNNMMMISYFVPISCRSGVSQPHSEHIPEVEEKHSHNFY